MNFPRLMFRTPGPEQCQGGSYTHKLVQDEDQFNDALQDGFHATLPEALAPAPIQNVAAPPADPVELTKEEHTEPPTYEEMKVKATELGLDYRSNISKAALLALITAKLAEQV